MVQPANRRIVTEAAVDGQLASKISSTGSAARAALNAAYATLDANGKQPVRKGELFLNARDYGAVGDGLADDYAAVQAWLNAGGTCLRDGTYRITAGLTLTGDNRELVMENATILADTADITVLNITGNNCRIRRVKIDGGNKANYGVKASGSGALIEWCLIENLYSTTLTTRGIEVTTTLGATIRNNTVRNIVSVGDATLGNNNGSARAIMITATAAATKQSVIENNVVDGVTGEEGDAVQVLFTPAVSNVYPAANVTIRNNQISNASRRFIKVQGSNVRVIGNTLVHDGAIPVNPATSIDIIQSENILVAQNSIGPNPLGVAIGASGASGSLAKNVIIRDNTIRQDDAKAYVSIFLSYMTETDVCGNTIYGGTNAVSAGNSTNLSIGSNRHFGGLSSSASFSANSSNTGVVMRLNLNMNSARTSVASNAGTGALTELNASRV